jgi:hypothetical protein
VDLVDDPALVVEPDRGVAHSLPNVRELRCVQRRLSSVDIEARAPTAKPGASVSWFVSSSHAELAFQSRQSDDALQQIVTLVVRHHGPVGRLWGFRRTHPIRSPAARRLG